MLLLSRLDHGGMERVQLNIAKSLHARGFDIVIAAGKINADPNGELPPDIRIVEIAPSGPASFPTGVVRVLRRERPDVVFTTANDVACLVLAMRAITFSDIRVIVTQHLSLSGPRLAARGLRRIKLELVRALMWLLVRRADKIVAVSDGVARDLQSDIGVDGSRIVTIHNPVIGSDFEERSCANVPWPWGDLAAPTFAFVGRLSKEKRLDLLISSFRRLLETRPARLIIVGTGPLHDQLSQEISTAGLDAHCRLTGYTENPLPYIRASCALVLCSDYEGFGNVLVEAMACGTQVIATDCPSGPAEILQGGKYGQLIPRGDGDALVGAMRRVLDERRIPAEKLIERAKDFSIERAIDAYHKLIQEIMQTNRASDRSGG
jgi:glycosyltransferase involved in cell wall biosynthesis